MKLNVTDDTKLTAAQLKSLLAMKKRKTDKSISTLKKNQMLELWQEWKARPIETPEYENELLLSVNKATVDKTISDNIGNSDTENQENIIVTVEI